MMNSLIGFFLAFFILFLLFGLCSFILWFFGAYGLYKIGDNSNIDKTWLWLSFIPILNLYVIGSIVKSIKISGSEIDNLKAVLPVAAFASILLSIIPLIGEVIVFIYMIFFFIVLYNFYKKLDEVHATLWIILSIVFLPIAQPIIFFSLRNRKVETYDIIDPQ